MGMVHAFSSENSASGAFLGVIEKMRGDLYMRLPDEHISEFVDMVEARIAFKTWYANHDEPKPQAPAWYIAESKILPDLADQEMLGYLRYVAVKNPVLLVSNDLPAFKIIGPEAMALQRTEMDHTIFNPIDTRSNRSGAGYIGYLRGFDPLKYIKKAEQNFQSYVGKMDAEPFFSAQKEREKAVYRVPGRDRTVRHSKALDGAIPAFGEQWLSTLPAFKARPMARYVFGLDVNKDGSASLDLSLAAIPVLDPVTYFSRTASIIYENFSSLEEEVAAKIALDSTLKPDGQYASNARLTGQAYVEAVYQVLEEKSEEIHEALWQGLAISEEERAEQAHAIMEELAVHSADMLKLPREDLEVKGNTLHIRDADAFKSAIDTHHREQTFLPNIVSNLLQRVMMTSTNIETGKLIHIQPKGRDYYVIDSPIEPRVLQHVGRFLGIEIERNPVNGELTISRNFLRDNESLLLRLDKAENRDAYIQSVVMLRYALSKDLGQFASMLQLWGEQNIALRPFLSDDAPSGPRPFDVRRMALMNDSYIQDLVDALKTDRPIPLSRSRQWQPYEDVYSHEPDNSVIMRGGEVHVDIEKAESKLQGRNQDAVLVACVAIRDAMQTHIGQGEGAPHVTIEQNVSTAHIGSSAFTTAGLAALESVVQEIFPNFARTMERIAELQFHSRDARWVNKNPQIAAYIPQVQQMQEEAEQAEGRTTPGGLSISGLLGKKSTETINDYVTKPDRDAKRHFTEQQPVKGTPYLQQEALFKNKDTNQTFYFYGYGKTEAQACADVDSKLGAYLAVSHMHEHLSAKKEALTPDQQVQLRKLEKVVKAFETIFTDNTMNAETLQKHGEVLKAQATALQEVNQAIRKPKVDAGYGAKPVRSLSRYLAGDRAPAFGAVAKSIARVAVETEIVKIEEVEKEPKVAPVATPVIPMSPPRIYRVDPKNVFSTLKEMGVEIAASGAVRKIGDSDYRSGYVLFQLPQAPDEKEAVYMPIMGWSKARDSQAGIAANAALKFICIHNLQVIAEDPRLPVSVQEALEECVELLTDKFASPHYLAGDWVAVANGAVAHIRSHIDDPSLNEQVNVVQQLMNDHIVHQEVHLADTQGRRNPMDGENGDMPRSVLNNTVLGTFVDLLDHFRATFHQSVKRMDRVRERPARVVRDYTMQIDYAVEGIHEQGKALLNAVVESPIVAGVLRRAVEIETGGKRQAFLQSALEEPAIRDSGLQSFFEQLLERAARAMKPKLRLLVGKQHSLVVEGDNYSPWKMLGDLAVRIGDPVMQHIVDGERSDRAHVMRTRIENSNIPNDEKKAAHDAIADIVQQRQTGEEDRGGGNLKTGSARR